MATIKVSFINIDVKNFVDETTGEMIEHFQLNLSDAVPCKKLGSDGVYHDDKQNYILKRSNVIRAMLQSASKELADVRRLRGQSFDATSLNAILGDAELEISAELVKAGTEIDGYIYKNDGYRYQITKVTLAKDVAEAVAKSRKAALAKALGF